MVAVMRTMGRTTPKAMPIRPSVTMRRTAPDTDQTIAVKATSRSAADFSSPEFSLLADSTMLSMMERCEL
jgi:hypothetical protein